MVGFSVDTKLFRELGELLVGKESTALIELIKNAYDADARAVVVFGEHLRDADNGRIVVKDDGLGMTSDEFRRGFLTIAGRTKTSGSRRSAVFGRHFTGEKGVGRLAAHKLARRVAIRSFRAGPTASGASALPPPVSAIAATIDWDAIERLETLDEVAGSDAVRLRELVMRQSDTQSGTAIAMQPLRRRWTQRMIDDFLREAATIVPPPATTQKLPDGLLRKPLLFDEAQVRDRSSSDPGFTVTFTGQLQVPALLLAEAAGAASWIAEASFDRTSGLLRMAIEPTSLTLSKIPDARGFRFEKHLGVAAGPSFQARILQRSLRTWDNSVQGIRVYMEGFRVAPYGESTDDWLNIAFDYQRRTGRRLLSLSTIDVADLPAGFASEELSLQGPPAYMGAVFLHRSSSPELEMLVNRKGSCPVQGWTSSPGGSESRPT